jgi:hypothetical protein
LCCSVRKRLVEAAGLLCARDLTSRERWVARPRLECVSGRTTVNQHTSPNAITPKPKARTSLCDGARAAGACFAAFKRGVRSYTMDRFAAGAQYALNTLGSTVHYGLSEPLFGASMPAALVTVLIVSAVLALPTAVFFTVVYSYVRRTPCEPARGATGSPNSTPHPTATLRTYDCLRPGPTSCPAQCLVREERRRKGDIRGASPAAEGWGTGRRCS